MQRAYFVIPDKEALPPDLEEVTKAKKFPFVTVISKIDRDYVEARSLTTVAYIVLKDAIEKLKSKEKMEEKQMRLMQFQIDDIIKTALLEDINYIDVTTDYLVDENSVSTAKYVFKGRRRSLWN